MTLSKVGLSHNPFANASFTKCNYAKRIDKIRTEPMANNDSSEQILTLISIHIDLHNSDITKAQLFQTKLRENDLDMRIDNKKITLARANIQCLLASADVRTEETFQSPPCVLVAQHRLQWVSSEQKGGQLLEKIKTIIRHRY
ncbi:MAG: hypothetical protein EZS28_011555 [Streblomastix strix]|uniref:Uncharacterized protein n=1 Tax=Streblomastix strix TaxID=222440 RepID=A0A5J4WDB2_9EUKA|nr:MAG: hypothetical protein EZS28_011555 [Streblomastix strix]